MRFAIPYGYVSSYQLLHNWRDSEVLLDTWKNVCWLSEFYVPRFDTFQVRVPQADVVT